MDSNEIRRNYTEYGSCEGELVKIERTDKGAAICINDEVFLSKVKCHISSDIANKVVGYIQDNKLFGERVSVSGYITYENNIPKELKIVDEHSLCRIGNPNEEEFDVDSLMGILK